MATSIVEHTPFVELLIDGAPNKLIARKLDISVRTAEFHRANILKKLDKYLFVELIAPSRHVQR